MSKLLCFSWKGFKRFLEDNNWNDSNLPKDWCFISIGEYEPYDEEPHLLKDADNVINLNFDDIGGYRIWDAIPDSVYHYTDEEKAKDNCYGMSDEDADRLFAFINKHLGKNIAVHCSAGVSRSQGVVRFMLDCYPDLYREEDTNPDNPCGIPNVYVTSMLKRRLYKDYVMNNPNDNDEEPTEFTIW